MPPDVRDRSRTGSSPRIRGRLPDPVAHRARRQAAGLPRLRGDLAEAACRSLDAERDFYEQHNAAVHRGAHQLAEEATDAFEARPRRRSPAFIGAPGRRGGVHQERHRGAQPRRLRVLQRRRRRTGRRTARFVLGPGDEIVVTEMEHHANLVPWQELRPPHRRDAALAAASTDDGRLDLDRPRRRVRHRAHQGLRVHPRLQRARHGQPGRRRWSAGPAPSARSSSLDACQSVPHLPVDVADARRRLRSPSPATRCSARSGVGVLWGRGELLAAMPPFLTGGSMIEIGADGGLDLRRRRRSGSRPACPMAAQAVGLAAAVDYLERARAWTASHAHEHALDRARCWPAWRERPWVRVVGPADARRPRRRGRLRRRRRARPRRRPGPRRRGRRRPGRAPLRLAAAPPVRRRRRRPARRFARLQHARRGRRRCSTALDRVPAVFGVASLMDLYQELILEHSKRPHHAGLREPFDAEVHHVNPTCGDEVTLRVARRRHRRRRRRHRRVVRRAGLLDLHRVAPRCSPTRSSAAPVTEALDDRSRRCAAMLTSRGAGPRRRGRPR